MNRSTFLIIINIILYYMWRTIHEDLPEKKKNEIFHRLIFNKIAIDQI